MPLRIDRLSAEVKTAIISARAEGKTWNQVAEIASQAAGTRLATTTVQRWYDLRVSQVEGQSACELRRIVELLESILQVVRK
jgi:hypothetical protein